METITLAIAMVIGITEVIKRTNYLSDRFTPLVALALGIIISILLNDFTADALFSGVVVGLSASGLWSGVKHSFK